MTGPDDTTTPDRHDPSDAGDAVPVDTDAGSATVVSDVARRRQATRPVAGRTGAIAAVVVVLLGVGVVSALAPPPARPPVPSAGDGTTVAPLDAHTSSVFCATGAGVDAGAGAHGLVVLTNTSPADVHGVETTVSESGGAPVRQPVTVPARGTSEVEPGNGLPPGATATTFTFAGGGVTGTALVVGAQGWSTAPCASQVAPQWDFAGGSTASGLLDLSLYNPTAAQAVVDVTFLTTSGTVLDPQAYQGVSIGAGQLVVEGLGAYVQGQAVVATMVQATSGALVASELDDMVVPSGSGLALVTGSPGTATTWRFAQTTVVRGGTVTLAMANPALGPVTADVTVGLPGATVEPRRVTIPGRTVASFVTSRIAGWPLGAAYSLTVTASGPIVVGRTVVAPTGAPSPQGGITMGTTTVAPVWLVPGAGATGAPPVSGASFRSLAVADPGTSPVQVTVGRLSGGPVLATVQVPADGVVRIGPKVVGGLEPLVVRATGPVGVEADYVPAGAPGIVSSAGFALGG